MDSADKIIGLNVGGKIYRTSRTTLTRDEDSFFKDLDDTPRDDQGNHFIDRDGKIFRHVLNYLRYRELVVPANFSEFGLLEREAGFFRLEKLKLSIRNTSEVGLIFNGGNVIKTTRKTLLTEKDSFFTKMLNGDKEVSRDSQGNYIMRRDGSRFHRVLQYLRDGGIFHTTEDSELDHLTEEAKHFQLDDLAKHIESVKSMRSTAKGKQSHSLNRDFGYMPHILHFYFRTDSPSVAYCSRNDRHDCDILETRYPIGHGAVAGVVDLQKITRGKAATQQHVVTYFRSTKMKSQQRYVPADENVRLEFYIPDS